MKTHFKTHVKDCFYCNYHAYALAGMMIAIPESNWDIFLKMSDKEFVLILEQLANNVNLAKFRKHTRGPKKSIQKRESDPMKPHVSTAKLLK